METGFLWALLFQRYKKKQRGEILKKIIKTIKEHNLLTINPVINNYYRTFSYFRGMRREEGLWKHN